MNQHTWLRILGVITSIGAYIMLLMGAVVTKTGSGEGCGRSWPFCHGKLIPESLPIVTVFEYSHRIISGIDGSLILLLTVWSWVVYQNDLKVKVLGFFSLFFVVLRGALGALTVVFMETLAKKALLALHFGFSLISFASVVLLTITLFQRQSEVKTVAVRGTLSAGLHYTIWAVTVYTYVVVYTGALVRHAGATMGCGYSFPLCDATRWPGFSSIGEIHLLHRMAGMSLWLFVLLLFIWIWSSYANRNDLKKGVAWALVLITLQAVSGVATVLLGGQVLAALVHTTIISVFFAVLCYLCMQIGLPWRDRRASE